MRLVGGVPHVTVRGGWVSGEGAAQRDESVYTGEERGEEMI